METHCQTKHTKKTLDENELESITLVKKISFYIKLLMA